MRASRSPCFCCYRPMRTCDSRTKFLGRHGHPGPRGGGGAGRRHNYGRETGGARAGGTVALRVAVVRARSPYRARAIIARRTRCAHFWSRGLSRLYRFVPFSRVCTDLDLTPLFFSSKMRPSNSPCFCCCRLMRRFGAFGRVVRQQRVAGVSDGGRLKTCFLGLQPENSGFGL